MSEISPEQRIQHLKDSVKLQASDLEDRQLLGVNFVDTTFGLYLDESGNLDGGTDTGSLSPDDRKFIIQCIVTKYAELFPDKDAEAARKILDH